MPESIESHSILVNALLAGHTLVTRQEAWWVAQEITPAGQLGERRPVPQHPAEGGWRLGLAR